MYLYNLSLFSNYNLQTSFKSFKIFLGKTSNPNNNNLILMNNVNPNDPQLYFVSLGVQQVEPWLHHNCLVMCLSSTDMK